MPTVGVVCNMDQSYQAFQTCIDGHENRCKDRNCHAPVYVLKSMRDNHIHRKGAGMSMSTLIGCPRAYALDSVFDLYETVISGWNKGRGSFVHAMMEYDTDPPPWLIREQRLYTYIEGVRLSGQPDVVDTKFKVLEDYKSKDNLPRESDKGHEFQFNGYAYLLKKGMWLKDHPLGRAGEIANIDIKVIGAQYVTWKTKAEKAWMKKTYPVWPLDETEAILTERIMPLKAWRDYGILPECNPYVTGRWKCDCVKYTDQLIDRGLFDTPSDILKEAKARRQTQIEAA